MLLQDRLQCNATTNIVILPHQHSLIYSSVQATTKFYFLVGTAKRTHNRHPQIIRWHVFPNPYIKINIDGSALGNPGITGAGGILRDHLGQWILGFFTSRGSNNK